MPRIVCVTRIQAPPSLCFDLARDVETHCMTAAFTSERALPPGRTEGLLGVGDVVIFEAIHLGIRQRLTARVVECVHPTRFVDVQVSGAFKALHHLHEFEADGSYTVMRDTVTWEAPLGPLGQLADFLFLKRHMLRFIEKKQANLKGLAEASYTRSAQDPRA